jgi:hypothetical protein
MTGDGESPVAGPPSPVVGRGSSRQATPSILKPKGKPLQWRFNYSDGDQEGSLPEARLALATGWHFKRV